MKKLISNLLFKRETLGEPVNYPTPGQPRIMRTVKASKELDFNTWAIHVHTTVKNNKF